VEVAGLRSVGPGREARERGDAEGGAVAREPLAVPCRAAGALGAVECLVAGLSGVDLVQTAHRGGAAVRGAIVAVVAVERVAVVLAGGPAGGGAGALSPGAAVA
jgi:hypothetical protein